MRVLTRDADGELGGVGGICFDRPEATDDAGDVVCADRIEQLLTKSPRQRLGPRDGCVMRGRHRLDDTQQHRRCRWRRRLSVTYVYRRGVAQW
jgi:hypothetical protein